MRSIDKYLARDANYLLNVGPKPRWHHPGRVGGDSAPDRAVVRPRARGVRRRGAGVEPDREPERALTRKGNTLYVHLHRDPVSDSVKLKPISRLPRRSTILNTGRPVSCVVDMAPSDHLEQAAYLRLAGLPANELAEHA